MEVHLLGNVLSDNVSKFNQSDVNIRAQVNPGNLQLGLKSIRMEFLGSPCLFEVTLEVQFGINSSNNSSVVFNDVADDSVTPAHKSNLLADGKLYGIILLQINLLRFELAMLIVAERTLLLVIFFLPNSSFCLCLGTSTTSAASIPVRVTGTMLAIKLDLFLSFSYQI